MKYFGHQMPTVTPQQIVAVVGAVIAVAVAFGLNLNTEQQAAIVALAAIVAGMLLHSDAKLRGDRALALATVRAAGLDPQTGQRIEWEDPPARRVLH
jgi:hypothetical protein